MLKEKGNISIHTENIFPIIKKWLYSDKDIFVRELISNGCDAVNKYKKLISLGEIEGNKDQEYKIKVYIDKENSSFPQLLFFIIFEASIILLYVPPAHPAIIP